jgi:hypothetical protein
MRLPQPGELGVHVAGLTARAAATRALHAAVLHKQGAHRCSRDGCEGDCQQSHASECQHGSSCLQRFLMCSFVCFVQIASDMCVCEFCLYCCSSHLPAMLFAHHP